MRRLTTPVFVTTVCLLLVSCQQDLSNSPPTEEKTQFSGDGFTLSHPQTISVVKTSVHDFDIYRFLHQGLPLLFAYVGNHPDFTYDSQPASSKSKGVINGLSYARVQIMGSNGPVSVSVLMEFPNDRVWPRYIHFWYAQLPPELQKIAEDIISSLKAQEAGSMPIPPGVIISDNAEFPPQVPTWEQVEKQIQEAKESLKAAQEAGKEVDPNVAAWVEQMEELVKRELKKPE